MITTYSDLSEFFKRYNPENKFKKFIKDKNSIKTILGFYIFDYSIIAGVKNFSSNRYFADAINIDLIPEIKKLKDIKIKLCKEYNIKKNDEKKLRNFILKKINNLIKKFNENRIPKIYKNKKKQISLKQMRYFNKYGYIVIKNAIPKNLITKILNKIKALSENETKKNHGFFYGSGKLQRIYHLIKKDSLFQEIIFHPYIIQMCDTFFNRPTFHQKYLLSSWHANLLNPSSEAQKLHVDSAVPEPLPSWPIRLNVNFILHDYNINNGATVCIPGSHKLLKKPDLEKKYKNKKKILAPKGSLVFWTGHLWHQSGENKSNKVRYALLACFATSIMREMVMEENPYISLNKNLKNPYTKKIRKLIGWDHGLK